MNKPRRTPGKSSSAPSYLLPRRRRCPSLPMYARVQQVAWHGSHVSITDRRGSLI